MRERPAPSGRLRSFGSVASQVTVAKYLSENRDTVSRERSLEVATLIGGETMFPWLPTGGADRERRPHIQYSAPCRPCVPPPRRSRRLGDCVYRRKVGSLRGSWRFVLILRGSWCTSGTARRNCWSICHIVVLWYPQCKTQHMGR